MELFVYVRNHGGRPNGSTYVGACVGVAPNAAHPETRQPLSSMAEFRVAAEVADPVGELRVAVREVFNLLGADKFRGPVYYSRGHCAIKLLLEPGFDEPHHVESELAEMLVMCSPKVGLRNETRPVTEREPKPASTAA